MTLQRKSFEGTIERGGQSFPTAFDVWADSDFRLRIEVAALSIDTWISLHSAMGKPASFSESLILQGIGREGETFFSDTVEVHGSQSGTSGNSIKISARKATVTLRQEQSTPTPFTRLWLRGFKSFRNPSVRTSLGLVHVQGQSKADRDEVSGSVTLQGDKSMDFDEWAKKADDFLTFMQRALSFAHGGRLQAPCLEVVLDRCLEATFYEGEGFGRSIAPIHYLNQAPFIEALAKRYEEPQPVPEMLWTAIGWLHMEIPFDEVRFLASMTALEALVKHLLPKTLTTVTPKNGFDSVRSNLLEALSTCDLDAAERQIFEGKIKGLNERTLAQKIQALRDHYELPKAIFTDTAIVGITKVRNNIVHTGVSAGRYETWPKVVFIREFVSQIVFHEIGYSGPYESYVGRYQTVHPDLEKAAPQTISSAIDCAAGDTIDNPASS